MKPRLLIADDHTLFNEGVKNLLLENFEIVAQVYDGAGVVPAIQDKSPDVVILDINLPVINGLTLAGEIKAGFPAVKIIFLSMYTEMRFVEEAKKLKVNGYLIKHSTREELIRGIEQVLSGKDFWDPKLDRIRVTEDDVFVKKFSLSPREIEIIALIRSGFSAGEIAEKLYLSHETVKTHRKNIYYKLNISKSTELIRFANENGI